MNSDLGLRRRSRKQSGNLAIESALSLIVFTMMLIAIMDFAQIIFQHQTLVERVRAAVRHGAVNTFDAGEVRNMVLYGVATPSSGAKSSFNLTADMVAVSRLGSGTPDDRVTVTVSNYTVLVLTPFFAGRMRGLPITGTLPYEGQ